jgi:hypothetical protein
MAMEIHVFFRGKLPSKAALGKTMKELDFPLSLKPATGPLEGQSGYMPMRLRREETGVEFDVFEGRSAIDEFELDGVDPSFDRVGNFRWGGAEDEMLAAMCGAAALAKLTNGIVFDEASDRLLSPDQAIEMAKEHLASVAPEKTRQSGTRPADIKRYLKPLLELRLDLALIDRMLIIRPVRHLLRGAFFDRTSDKYRFEIWRFLEPLYGGPALLGLVDSIYGWAWPVWQPYFRPLLVDCLAEDIFESVGKILTLEDFANDMALVDPDRRGSPHYFDASVRALVLAGERDRAREFVDKMERSDPESRYWPHWAKEQREFLARDTEAICSEFHAKEDKLAKASKLGDVWEPTPFPVELPQSERTSQLADPLFRPTPWIPRPPELFGDPPEMPGEVRFAKDWLRRSGRVMLIAPLTPAEAQERHRNVEPYVLAARLERGALALLDHGGRDGLDPMPWSFRNFTVQLHGAHDFVRADYWKSRDKDLLLLSNLEVRKHGLSPFWHCHFSDKEDERTVRDSRTELKDTRSLSSQERALTRFPQPEFGRFDDVVQRIFALLQIEGYGYVP